MSRDVQPSPPDKSPPSFGGLAKKIRGRTSDLLAIAIVVAGGFAVGSQVSRWWDKPDDAAKSSLRIAGDPALAFGEHDPVTLDFGNSPYAMIRSVIQGDRKAATQRLVDDCHKTAESTPIPSHPPSAAETKLLSRIKTEKPLLTGDGWRLFRVEGPLTMVSVVRDQRARPADAKAVPRVVCWGLVFPAGEKRWVLYRFVSAAGEARSAFGVSVPLPGSATPLLTVRGRDNLWRTFRSTEPVESARAHYIGWFREHGWTMTGSSGEWTATFTKDDLRADVQISAQGRAGCTGVVVVTNSKSN